MGNKRFTSLFQSGKIKINKKKKNPCLDPNSTTSVELYGKENEEKKKKRGVASRRELFAKNKKQKNHFADPSTFLVYKDIPIRYCNLIKKIRYKLSNINCD